MAENYKWRVTFDERVEHVYAARLEEAIVTAVRCTRPQDGLLRTVELYNHGEKYPWGMVYVAPQQQKATTAATDARLK